MQHKIVDRKKLLTKEGVLSEAGYATSLLLDYDRSSIKANKLRIKEWDYYLITSEDFALALTIADNSYMGLSSISFIDFRTLWQITKSPMRLFPMGRTKMPQSSIAGDTKVHSKKYKMQFIKESNRRILKFSMDNFHIGNAISGEIELEDDIGDSMVIATPFKEDRLAFYYNQKINCIPAKGYVKLGNETFIFQKDEAFATLDWGRGVWIYKNTWYWGSASGLLDGTPFGFNIGYGFGDASAASENMLFFNGQAHKLSRVTFYIPQKDSKDNYMEPWYFTSDDGRFEMNFIPAIDRSANLNVGILCSIQHQVFGRFTGQVILDDGTVLNITNFLGFAEKVYSKW